MPEVVIFLFVLFGCVCIIAHKVHRASQDDELRKTNPDVWIRKKEVENAEKQRKHERRQGRMKVGGFIGMTLWKLFMKK